MDDAGTLKDPVCGMSVKPDSPHRHVHEGEALSSSARRAASRSSARSRSDIWPGSSTSAEKAPAPTKTTYTCPMHPEVVRDGPGSCPICGMALEPIAPSLDEEDNAELRDMTRRFWFGAALTVPVFAIAMGHMIPGHPLSAAAAGAVARARRARARHPGVSLLGVAVLRARLCSRSCTAA